MSALDELISHCGRFGIPIRVQYVPEFDLPWVIDAQRAGVHYGDAGSAEDLHWIAQRTLDDLMVPADAQARDSGPLGRDAAHSDEWLEHLGGPLSQKANP